MLRQLPGAIEACSVPGCTNKRSGDRVCYRHRLHPTGDMYCQICGFGPRVKLYHHVTAEHDGTAAYKKRFGKNSLVSEGYRKLCRALYEDRKRDGSSISDERHRKTCRNGHRLAGDNIIHSTAVVKGRPRDAAMSQVLVRVAQRIRAEEAVAEPPAWRKRHRKCVICREAFLPVQKHQRCCPATRCRREREPEEDGTTAGQAGHHYVMTE